MTDTFIQLADGKLNGQKAFMTGALKVKGNVMLAVSTHHPYVLDHGSWYMFATRSTIRYT